MKYFKIPYARNNANFLIAPSAGRKNESYFCPKCDSKVIFRAGMIRAKHFAHKVDPENVCDGHQSESQLHKAAKFMVYTEISEWIHEGKLSPSIKKSCAICGQLHNKKISEIIVASEVLIINSLEK